MSNDTIVSFSEPVFRDALSDGLRPGAQRMMREAVEGVGGFSSRNMRQRDASGRRAVVRNGYPPKREVLTGIGAVRVQVPQDAGSSGRRALCSLRTVAAVFAEDQAAGGGDTVVVS
jgi:putative transposase